jgi:hypothetical protein
MTAISFKQSSPRGNATIDSAKLLFEPSGAMFICSGDGRVPVSDEQEAALRAHFGPLLTDALAAVKALS